MKSKIKFSKKTFLFFIVIFAHNLSGLELQEPTKSSPEILRLCQEEAPISFMVCNAIKEGSTITNLYGAFFYMEDVVQILRTHYSNSLKFCFNNINIDEDISNWLLAELHKVVPDLQALAFVNCGLTSVPQNIGLFKQLQRLDLSQNPALCEGFEFIPINIHSLILKRCNLTDIPRNITHLISLSVLDLSSNPFMKPKDSIFLSPPMYKLPGIKTMLIYGCWTEKATQQRAWLNEEGKTIIEANN